MAMKSAPPANAITDFAAWLTCRKEVSGPFSASHAAAPMAELVEEYCKIHGLEYDETFSCRDDDQQDVAPEDTSAGGMSDEDHIAWFFHDVMCSWAGRKVWEEYARTCHEFKPYREQLPPKFREAWLRLVSIWADR